MYSMAWLHGHYTKRPGWADQMGGTKKGTQNEGSVEADKPETMDGGITSRVVHLV